MYIISFCSSDKVLAAAMMYGGSLLYKLLTLPASPKGLARPHVPEDGTGVLEDQTHADMPTDRDELSEGGAKIQMGGADVPELIAHFLKIIREFTSHMETDTEILMASAEALKQNFQLLLNLDGKSHSCHSNLIH